MTRESDFYRPHNPEDEIRHDKAFFDLFALHAELSTATFSTREDIFERAIPRLANINQRLYHRGILGKKVIMEGKNISVAELVFDDEIQANHVEASIVEAGFHESATYPPIHGYLSAFTLNIQHRSTNEDYLAQINSRVLVESNVATPLFSVDLYAHAPLDSSSITFNKDKHNRAYTHAINTLADTTHDEQTALTTATIEDLLSPNEEHELFDPYRLRKIGRAVRMLEKSHGISMAYRDGIINLVASRLGIDGVTCFAVDAISSCTRNPDGTIQVPEGSLQKSVPFFGLEFAPYHWRQNGVPMYKQDEDMLSLFTYVTIASDETKIGKPLFVPLEKLRMFYPES